jgi:probable phosphoglycerate mutase
VAVSSIGAVHAALRDAAHAFGRVARMSPPESPHPRPGDTAVREARQRAEPHARVYLVRHAEPDWAPGGRSVLDPELTPFGLAQAGAVAKRLCGEDLDAVYASPYRRSQQTAAALAAATGLGVETVPGLAEIGVAVEGLTQEQVHRYFVAGARRPLEEHWEGWPGSESFRAFHARVTAAVGDVLGRHGIRMLPHPGFGLWQVPERGPRIAIVAHGGTNAVALTHLLDVPPVPWEWLRFESELAAFSVLQARSVGPEGQVWSLQNFNELDHLRAAGLHEA